MTGIRHGTNTLTEWAKGWWAVVAGQPEAGNGGILVGSVGTEGPVCNRWRAARVMLILDIDMAMISKSMNTNLVPAIFWTGGTTMQQHRLAHLPGDWTLETFSKWGIQETLGKHMGFTVRVHVLFGLGYNLPCEKKLLLALAPHWPFCFHPSYNTICEDFDPNRTHHLVKGKMAFTDLVDNIGDFSHSQYMDL
ncbi:hypothetical protein Cgig2_007354 [Carnegiea gigantea]|uniref:Uncharacterized protein n=1 Tax=Carnegiea gigantea TaxID=171969 RepID=A0A9Q1KVX4_9CARY|nr:hypothetical protein Cgig2_007354 [Carnegiea gigantea]